MKTYEEIRGFKPDFVVRYRLYSPEEGGRKVTYQHLRCDFMYEEDSNASNNQIYMIHPEFISENEIPIAENIPISLSGKSFMWVLVPEMRNEVHRQKIQIGTKGYFVEGPKKIGEVIVEKLIGLLENPA